MEKALDGILSTIPLYNSKTISSASSDHSILQSQLQVAVEQYSMKVVCKNRIIEEAPSTLPANWPKYNYKFFIGIPYKTIKFPKIE